MSELERLETLIKHHINKELGLLKYLNDEIERVSQLIELTDSYTIQSNWRFYIKALKRVYTKLIKLEKE